jgi:hypothetical protein
MRQRGYLRWFRADSDALLHRRQPISRHQLLAKAAIAGWLSAAGEAEVRSPRSKTHRQLPAPARWPEARWRWGVTSTSEI